MGDELVDQFRKILAAYSTEGLRVMLDGAMKAVLDGSKATFEPDFVPWMQALQDELASR
jgi:hypothetical protein